MNPEPAGMADQGAQRPRANTATYYLAFIGLGMVTVSLGPTLTGLATQTNSDLAQIGILFTARSLGYLLGSYLAGHIFDRWAGHPSLFGALLIVAGLMALVPLVNWLLLLTLLLLFVGIVESVVDVGGNTLLLFTHRRNAAPYMNGLHFFFGVGAFIAPLIVGQALDLTGGIAWAYWGLALLIAPIAFLFLPLPSPRPRPVAADTPAGKAPPRRVALFTLFFVLYVAVEISFGGWIAAYVTTLALAPAADAAYLTSGFWGAFTAGRLLSVPLAARWRPTQVLWGSLAGGLFSLLFLWLAAGRLPLIWAGAMTLGLSLAAIFPTTLALAERSMPLTSRVTSWFFVGGGTGAMIVPPLIGGFFERTGPQALPPILLTLMVLNCVVLLLLTRQKGSESLSGHVG